MTLSERLQQAKKERLIAAGVLPSEEALKPVDELARTEDESSMLRSSPSRLCPRCRQPGRVDLVDLVGHTTHMTCDECRTMWLVYDR